MMPGPVSDSYEGPSDERPPIPAWALPPLDVTPMNEVEDAVNDLDISGGEISYRASDLLKELEGKNLKPNQKAQIVAAAEAAVELVNRLGKIRRSLGLKERPEEYRRVPPGGK